MSGLLKSSPIEPIEWSWTVQYSNFGLSFYDDKWIFEILYFQTAQHEHVDASPVHRVRRGHDADSLPCLHTRHTRHRTPRHLLQAVPGIYLQIEYTDG